MLKEKKQIIALIIFILVAFGLSLLITIIVHNNKLKHFSLIENNDKLNSTVKSIEEGRAGAFIIFTNNEKKIILTCYNYNYIPSAIDNFIKVGDVIEKSAFSDTIVIHRDSNCFYFG
jgi:hypothetical protein